MADEQDNPPNPAPAPKQPEPETFSREYVRELREENKGWRLKATQQEQAAKAAKEAAEKAQADADTKATEAENRANERVIRAELKAAALKAGMVDLDGLKLADLSTVKLNDQGEVEGADELMTKLKETKPYLFKQQNSTSNPNEPPKPGDKPPKKATEMTAEEYAAEKKRLGIK